MPPLEPILNRPWHVVLRDLHAHCLPIATALGVIPFSATFAKCLWRWAGRVGRLPEDRWARRLLLWDVHAGWQWRAGDWRPPPECSTARPIGRNKFGRPFLSWEACITSFWKATGKAGTWRLSAADDPNKWVEMEAEFVAFRSRGR